jgi:putative transposase
MLLVRQFRPEVAHLRRKTLLEWVKDMARFARVVATEVAHHVTQRGNARQFILDSAADREVYLSLLREDIEPHHVSLIGYCLMSNHVHLVMVPHQADALAKALKRTHGRYAAYWNAQHGSSGHVWQGRYYSCPLGRPHLWEALRYTELNPVRARLVAEAEAWTWSSAAVHCGATAADGWLEMEEWKERWDVSRWRKYLIAGETESEVMAVRQYTHTGRPLGSEEFVHELEEATQRPLVPRKGGRPAKWVKDERQSEIVFEP